MVPACSPSLRPLVAQALTELDVASVDLLTLKRHLWCYFICLPQTRGNFQRLQSPVAEFNSLSACHEEQQLSLFVVTAEAVNV